MAPLRPPRLGLAQADKRGAISMFDLLLAMLGTGGILLMGAYAAFCEHV